jgi:hypothetical protein
VRSAPAASPLPGNWLEHEGPRLELRLRPNRKPAQDAAHTVRQRPGAARHHHWGMKIAGSFQDSVYGGLRRHLGAMRILVPPS